MAQDSLDSAVRLDETRLDSTGTPHMDVSTWLRDLGLENYAQAFQAHDIDAEVLPRLTADDLTALGITSIGHRRKLLDAIAALDQGRAAAAAEPIAATVRPVEAERRQLTVLFCDLVGSTALAARLDPEDLREIIGAYHRCCAEVVGRWGGHVAKYMGDGVLAYFGWPQAHEDDAERAVRAGLELVQEVGRVSGGEAPLSGRVGIATGAVVVGDLLGEGAAQEQGVVGTTPNLAARLQEFADPGHVVIGRRTRRLISGLFDLEDLGTQQLKGFAEPVPAWRVRGEGPAESRFDARQVGELTPMVGRDHEFALLLDRWRQAKAGEGQVVLLAGEPGVGKSRLVRALRAFLEDEPHTRLSHFCSPYHQDSALHPVIGLLERAAGLSRDEPSERQLDKLEALLALGTSDVREVAPLIAHLLSIPTGERYPPLMLSSQRQKESTLAALLDQVAGLAARQPVLALYEDLHWSDPTTLELLDSAVDRIQNWPVLAVFTFRPEFRAPWIGFAHVTLLTLNRLNRRQAAAMVEQVTRGKALPREVLEQIVAKTDGVPLFVEELTKTVLESGLLEDAGERYVLSGPLPPLAIPASLYDSLMARLDRLAPVKEVAQVGAVMGREFGYELLAAVTSLDDRKLRDGLQELANAELVFRHGTPPHAIYTFKHALVRDAAYASLLRGRRQQLHARIATVLDERFPETVEAEPHLVAHHCTEAGLIEKAVDFWLKAGQQASERSAYIEAARHASRGLDLIATSPERAEHRLRELDLRLVAGAALMATKGYAADEVERHYTRAWELCRQVGQTPKLFPALHGLYRFYHVRGELETAREVGQQLMDLAQRVRDPALIVEASRALGVPLFWLGAVESAQANLERGAAVYDLQQHRSHASLYGIDPGVVCLSYSALASWTLGYPERALAKSHQALALSRELSHRHSLSLALVWAAWLCQFRRDAADTRAHAEAAVSLCVEESFPLWMAMGVILRGWALAQEGQKEAAALIRQGLADLRATGAGLWQPSFLALLAEVHAQDGLPEEGLGALAEALAIAQRNGERFYESEIHRLTGDMLLQLPGPHAGDAESRYCEALSVARRQEAKSWELRAATSLARLCRDRGRRAEAHDLLAPVYGWFTEGFNTVDLKDAKALLDQLA
jgi:predicted ATPase/class 3 adenylate cyclase